jgi:CRP/FNR family transcriptional regulator
MEFHPRAPKWSVPATLRGDYTVCMVEKSRDKLIDRYTVLRQISPEMAERLVGEGKVVQFPAGEIIFDLSSSCDGYVFFLEGVLRVSSLAENGREILLYRLFPGESCIVTTSCLISNAQYPVRATAEESVGGVWIPRALFLELLHGSRAFSEHVFRSFAQHLTTLLQLVEEVAFHRLDTRLARLLLERGAEIDATHQEIAAELGSVREIVSRILKSFEEQGWVRLSRKHVSVVNPGKLQEIAR